MDTNQNESTLPVFLSLKDASNLLAISYSTLHQMALDGELPARKVGGQWRMLQDDLTAWFRDGYTVRTQTNKNNLLGAAVPVQEPSFRSPNRDAAKLAALLKDRKKSSKRS